MTRKYLRVSEGHQGLQRSSGIYRHLGVEHIIEPIMREVKLYSVDQVDRVRVAHLHRRDGGQSRGS